MKTPIAPNDLSFLSARDVIQCHTKIQNKLDIDTDNDLQLPIGEFVQAIMDAGNDYENVVGNELLKAVGVSNCFAIDTTKKLSAAKIATALESARALKLVIFIGDRSAASLTLREVLTHAILEVPGNVRILWNPRLRKWKKNSHREIIWGTRSAEPDILYRQNVRVARSPKWSAIDVKHHDPFEGTMKERQWDASALGSPFPRTSEETAHQGTPRKDDALQLAHYYRALEFHSAAGTPIGGIIGKPINGETRVLWVNLTDTLFERATTDALSMYDKLYTKALAVAEREIARRAAPTLPHLAPPEWKDECKTCPWRDVCIERLTEADDITLLPGMTPPRAVAHRAAGVNTVKQLAYLDTTTASLVEAGVPKLDVVIEAARAASKRRVGLVTLVSELDVTPKEASKIIPALTNAGFGKVRDVETLDLTTAGYAPGTPMLITFIDQARVEDYARLHRTPMAFRDRGVGELIIPTPAVEMHVDMENDTKNDKEIYLWGMYTKWCYKTNRVRRNYHPYVDWTATQEGEARAFAGLWAGMWDMIKKAQAQEGENEVGVFHYSPAEDRCMLALAKKYAGLPGIPTIDEVQDFLDSDMWIDLLPVMTKQLIWPTKDATLKTLARFTQFEWRDDEPGGANSTIWYQRAIDPIDPEQLGYQQRILDYNEDDCLATAALLEWLKVRGEAHSLDKKLPRVETLEKRYSPRKVS